MWTENWKLGNPPKFMVHFFYYFLNLPWLTQDSKVKLGPVETVKYDNKYFKQELRDVYTIKMEFKEKPTVGKVKDDWFKLYIDPGSYNVVAYEYAMGYGAMLDLFGFPEDQKIFGPVFRHIDVNTNVGGLIFPTQMHITNGDQSRIFGQHVLINYDISKPFDASKLNMPSEATIDNSSAERKSQAN